MTSKVLTLVKTLLEKSEQWDDNNNSGVIKSCTSRYWKHFSINDRSVKRINEQIIEDMNAVSSFKGSIADVRSQKDMYAVEARKVYRNALYLCLCGVPDEDVDKLKDNPRVTVRASAYQTVVNAATYALEVSTARGDTPVFDRMERTITRVPNKNRELLQIRMHTKDPVEGKPSSVTYSMYITPHSVFTADLEFNAGSYIDHRSVEQHSSSVSNIDELKLIDIAYRVMQDNYDKPFVINQKNDNVYKYEAKHTYEESISDLLCELQRDPAGDYDVHFCRCAGLLGFRYAERL